MTETVSKPAEELERPRRAWLAFLLGFVSAGLGHVYAGRPWRGVGAFLFLLLLFVPLGEAILILFLGSPARTILGLTLLCGLAVLVPIDGAIVARRRRAAPLTRWNRDWVYPLYFAATSSIALMVPPYLVSYYPVRMLRVPSGAMEPNLLVGDVVLADVLHRGSAGMVPGEPVVFEVPAQPGIWSVKRLAGLPGQTVEMRDGVWLVDGRPASQRVEIGEGSRILESLGEHRYEIGECDRCSWGPGTVPTEHVFVLGDNRSRSADSRVFGFVPVSAIRGRVLGVAWSSDAEEGVRWARFGKRI